MARDYGKEISEIPMLDTNVNDMHPVQDLFHQLPTARSKAFLAGLVLILPVVVVIITVLFVGSVLLHRLKPVQWYVRISGGTIGKMCGRTARDF